VAVSVLPTSGTNNSFACIVKHVVKILVCFTDKHHIYTLINVVVIHESTLKLKLVGLGMDDMYHWQIGKLATTALVRAVNLTICTFSEANC